MQLHENLVSPNYLFLSNFSESTSVYSRRGRARLVLVTCGGPFDAHLFNGLDDLVRDQIMSMKTTFTPGHYRRRVAGVLARRLVQKLFDA